MSGSGTPPCEALPLLATKKNCGQENYLRVLASRQRINPTPKLTASLLALVNDLEKWSGNHPEGPSLSGVLCKLLPKLWNEFDAAAQRASLLALIDLVEEGLKD
jgi:hypothetical protein